MGQLKTLGTDWGTQSEYLFGYTIKPVLSRLLIQFMNTISNQNSKQPKLRKITCVQLK